jgi:hypothetical protein
MSLQFEIFTFKNDPTNLENFRVIQDHADDEHGGSPSDGTKHPLAAILVLVLLTQQRDHGGVGQCDRRRAKNKNNEINIINHSMF